MRVCKFLRSPTILALLLAPLAVSHVTHLGTLTPPSPAAVEPADRSETTMGLISAAASRDGRPMLWKNRDRRDYPDNEAAYFTDGAYNYVALTNAGDSDEAWGGANATGFAIVNSNIYNLVDTVAGGDDDGFIMKLALQQCRAVDDFQAILDSTNQVGRRLLANYGVIDGSGGAALFECSAATYVRFDPSDSADAPEGFLVRANFAYSGDDSGHFGQWRHDRAYALMQSAVETNDLTPSWMLKNVARDIALEVVDPYPLPFEDVYPDSGWPPGFLPTYTSVNRNITRFGVIIEGVREGEDADLTTLYVGLGAPVAAIPIPLWVRGAATPVEMNGDSSALLCDITNRILARLYNPFLGDDVINTVQLLDGRGNGLFTITTPTMDTIFQRTEEVLARWQEGMPDPAEMVEFENWAAHYASDRLQTWRGRSLVTVPNDYPTLQEAVDASQDGDTVLVERGIHTGPLLFKGRNILVTSRFLLSRDPEDIDSTVIDGGRNGRSVVVFNTGESSQAELNGFTLRNGLTGYGGGIYINGASPTLQYLVIRSNTANRNGGGIYCTQSARPTLDHITLQGNAAVVTGGAIHCYANATASISNSIIWGNSPPEMPDTVQVQFSNVEGGAEGEGNIALDPRFVEPDSGNLHLAWPNFPANEEDRSPCIDAGDPAEDVEPDGTRPDMGALSFDQGPPARIEVVPDSINFEGTPPGSYASSEVAISNIGNRILHIVSQVMETVEGPPFIYVSSGGGAFELGAGEAHRTVVTFAPQFPAWHRAELTINSDDEMRPSIRIPISGSSVVEGVSSSGAPTLFSLEGTYPNPFNSKLSVVMGLPRRGRVDLRLFDITGRLTLLQRYFDLEPGYRTVPIEGTTLPSGVFLLVLNYENALAVKKVLLMR